LKYEEDINEILNNKSDSKKSKKLSENEQIDSMEQMIQNACPHEKTFESEFGCVVNFPEGEENHLYELSCFWCSSSLTTRFIERIDSYEKSINEIDKRTRELEKEIRKLIFKIDNIGSENE